MCAIPVVPHAIERNTMIGKSTLNAFLGLAIMAVIQPAHAGRGEIVRLNNAGFEQCRALRSTGEPYWKGTATGDLLDGDSAGFGVERKRFRINSCFETKAKCERFVANIPNQITGVDVMRFVSCRAQG